MALDLSNATELSLGTSTKFTNIYTLKVDGEDCILVRYTNRNYPENHGALYAFRTGEETGSVVAQLTQVYETGESVGSKLYNILEKRWKGILVEEAYKPEAV